MGAHKLVTPITIKHSSSGSPAHRRRVMTTPQGTGEPTNLWPDTEMEPMGFLKVTMGARLTKGICRWCWRGDGRPVCGWTGAWMWACRQVNPRVGLEVKQQGSGSRAGECQTARRRRQQQQQQQRTIMPNSAPSQWMKKRSSV